MSIVRIGMSEDNKFADGYNAIFGNQTAGKPDKKSAAKKPAAPKATAKKKPVAKKPAKKKS